MIQDIFLAYANNSLEQEPEKLKEILDEFLNIQNIFLDDTTSKRLKRMVTYFPDVVKQDNLSNDRGSSQDSDPKVKDFQIVFEAVHGYRDDYCSSKCRLSGERKSIISDENFSGPERLKCFECDQLFFQHILIEIINGRDYLEIDPDMALERMLNHAYRYHQKVIVALPNSRDLEEMIFFFPDTLYIENLNKKEMFREIFFRSVVGYSLVEFLQKDNPSKLKKCKDCGQFFVAKKADERTKRCPTCSSKRQMPKEERKEYQKEYRAKKSAEKEKKKPLAKEMEIERLMANLDLPREEATKLWEDDRML
jgi:hypothetical protein